jgi:hypothetical protein
MVNCREVVEALGDHVEGTLPPLQRWRLRIHLWICQHCRNYLSSYKTTLRAEKAAHSDGQSEAAPDTLVKLIVSAAAKSRSDDEPRHDGEEQRPLH